MRGWAVRRQTTDHASSSDFIGGSVVVHDRHIGGAIRCPAKADPVTCVDPDAELTEPIAAERLEPVGRRHPQVRQRLGGMQRVEFPSGDRPQQARTLPPGCLGIPSAKHVLGACTGE